MAAGNVAQWKKYTTGPYRNIEVPGGDHYFVSSHYRQVQPHPLGVVGYNDKALLRVALAPHAEIAAKVCRAAKLGDGAV